MNFDLQMLGLPDIPQGLERLWNETRRALNPKPFRVVWAKGGAALESATEVTIWLPRPPTAYVVAHELAHILNGVRNSETKLQQGYPTEPVRRVVSDLVALLEHPVVHEILHEYGFDTTAECAAKSESFLTEIASFKAGQHPMGDLHFAVGYALMMTAYRSSDYAAPIEHHMEQRLPTVKTLGDRLLTVYHRYAGGEINLEQGVKLLCNAATLPSDLRAALYSREAFVAKYWKGKSGLSPLENDESSA